MILTFLFGCEQFSPIVCNIAFLCRGGYQPPA